MFKKVIRYASDPYYALGYDMIKKCPRLMSDKFYLSVLWKMVMGYELDWKNPKTFSEKLQWLKFHDHNPLYTKLVDKYRVKQWVADKIGKQYIIPTLEVYDSVDEIDLNKLPDQFVLKCNHDSGSVVICKDKSTFELEVAKKKLGEKTFTGKRGNGHTKMLNPVFLQKHICLRILMRMTYPTTNGIVSMESQSIVKSFKIGPTMRQSIYMTLIGNINHLSA